MKHTRFEQITDFQEEIERLESINADLLKVCEILQKRLERLINLTPTGNLRKYLTDDNILALQTINKAKGK